MSSRIDNFLINHTPQWYRTSTVQTATLGVVFFWVFAAYTTMQFYAATTYGPDLAADCVSSVYFTFTISCLFSPSVTNKLGCRATMFLGVLAYASLVLTSIIYFLYGGESVLWSRRLVVIGGAILGCGASLLWVAQGRLILQYSKLEDDHMGTIAKIDSAESKNQTGVLMGMFWAIFQCSALVGGGVSFLYFNKKPQGTASLYALFFGFILIGAIFTLFLLPPSMLQTVDSIGIKDGVSEKTPLIGNSEEMSQDAMSSFCELKINKEHLSTQTWIEESRDTFDVFMTKRMAYTFLLFFYTGFNQPYQQATFGNRFFTRRTIGAELIIFHLMEILGAILVGNFLDNSKISTNLSSERKRAKLCLLGFVAINSIGNALAAIQEFYASNNVLPIAHDISGCGVIPPSLAFACWGFADAQIQVYCYWLIGNYFKTGQDHARAVGFYKFVQSFGTSIGFFLIPASRLGPSSQLAISSLVFIGGTGLSFLLLPL